MALKTFALPYLLCIINLVFFTLVSSHYVPCPPPPPSPKPACPPPPSPKPACPPPSTQPPSHHGGYPTGPPTPTAPKSPPKPKPPPMPKSPPMPKPPPMPKSPPMPISPPTPTPTPVAPPTPTAPPPGSSCPIDVLKLAACANVLTGLADVVLGVPPQNKCCPLLSGLTDLDAAVCLCTALNANILGINLNIPLSLSVLLNYCDKAGDASSFQCPSTTPPTPATPTPPTPTPPTPTPPTPPPPTPTPPTPTPPTPTPPTPTPPTPVTPTTPPATPPPTSAPPTPTPATPPPPGDQCPIDVLKLATCANVLNGLLDAVLGVPPQSQCCPLLDGLADLDAAICLCTALNANLLGINLNVPVSLSLLLNYCNKAGVPSGFQCPSTQTPPTPTPATPTPATPTPATPTPATPTPATPTPATPTPATPTTATPPTPSGGDNCPIDVLKLGACANVLSGLVDAVLGTPPQSQCCPLLEGLTDLDAAICLCTALKANVLGINLNVPVSLSVLLNSCDKSGAPGFQCS